MRNLITDVPGLKVGSASDAKVASGVTVVVFDAPAVASIAVHGGAPGLRDAALLEPEMMVDAIDALALSGGSAFGLDATGGILARLAEMGRGFAIGSARVPIAPTAILFDLLNGGDKAWGRKPPYWELGYAAVEAAGLDFALGSVGAGLGATTYDLKGGLGSASAVTPAGFRVGALVAVNAVGRTTMGRSRYFWAAPYERDGEFGGLGLPPQLPADALDIRLKGDGPINTTIGIVVTDAPLTKAQAKRIAVQAQDGFALAVRPAHTPMDGDVVFAASTARALQTPSPRDLAEIGALAADCLARAVARGVYSATALPFPDALPAWRDRRGLT